MPLHPEAEAERRRRAAGRVPPLYTLSPEEARAADLAAVQAGSGAPEPVGAVWHRTIPGPDGDALVVRGYEPRHDGDSAAPATHGRPALVYLFGGGWTLGDLDTGDAVCRSLTNAAGCLTLAVRYRLAPENPFPAAVADAYAAVRWLAENAAALGVDPTRLAVGGDSAGGNLAAAVTLAARDRGGPELCHQLLVYPNTDHGADTVSLRECDDPLLFNRRSVAWYWSHYLADPADGANPLASPLRAASHAGLPAATVITAEVDPLRDEGELYARRLAEAGVAVALRRYDGMPHGFFAMPGLYQAGREAQAFAAARLAAAFR